MQELGIPAFPCEQRNLEETLTDVMQQTVLGKKVQFIKISPEDIRPEEIDLVLKIVCFLLYMYIFLICDT